MLLFLVVKEFCKISLDFIRKGVNRKVYQSAARNISYCIMVAMVTL